MSYIPPITPSFNFSVAYAPPASPVTINFAVDSALLPTGFDSLTFGAHSIATRRFITVDGSDYSIFGSAGIIGPRYIAPSGFASQSMGAPVAINRQILAAFGINSFLLGALEASLSVRDVYPVGFNALATGTPMIAYRERFLYPQWFTTLFMGSVQVGRHQQISPSGFLSEVMGEQRVRDNRQLVEQAGGLNAGVFGAPYVALRLREIRAPYLQPEAPTRIGTPYIYNSRRYITPEYIASQWINDAYGLPYLANRNRVVDLIINGIKPPFRSVSPFADIKNNSRAINPEGFEGVFGNQLVAHRIRSVYPVGFDSFTQIPHFHVVFNRAYVAAPTGFNAQAFGAPSLVNTRRYMPPVGIAPDDAYGTPFIAPRVRHLTPVIGIQPQLMEGTIVWFGTRSITPKHINWPFAGSAFGNLEFTVVERKLRPSGIAVPPPRWGDNRIFNRTRQVGPYWYSDLFTLFGRTAIFNRNNYFQQTGFATQAFGPTTQIADRTRRLGATGSDTQRFGLHNVRNVIAEPPATQFALPGLLGDVEDGMLEFGATKIHANSIYPTWADLGSFGTARASNNSIRPAGMPAYFDPLYGGQFGRFSVNGPQKIKPKQFILGEVSKPRVSPHTIYCTRDITQQASENHPGELFHPINGLNFGDSVISLYRRRVYPFEFDDSVEFGTAALSTNPTRVNLAGIKSQKFGIPEITDPYTLRVRGIPDTSRFGVSSVNHVDAFVRYLRPLGGAHLVFGDPDPQLKNRAVLVPGQKQDESDFGLAWVQRPPPPVEPAGQVLSRWGNNMIAYRIRSASFQGFDSFVCDYDPGSFELRMRVTRRNYVRPAGLSGQVFGHIGIGPRPVHRIAPDGFTSWPIQPHAIAHA